MNETGKSAWDELKAMTDYDFESEHIVQVPPVPLGVKAIDDALGGGVATGTFTVIGGEGGAGKSALACQSLYSAAWDGRYPIYFSLEMPHQMVINRLLSIHTARCGLPQVFWSTTRNVVSGNIARYNENHNDNRQIRTVEDVMWYDATFGEHDNVIQAWRHFKQYIWPRMVVYDVTVTIDWICGVVRSLVADGLHPMPIIDYVQLAPTDEVMSEYEAVTNASKALQQMAKECMVPCIVLSSLRKLRENERDKEPTQDMLRGSAQLAYDAGAVIILTKNGGRTSMQYGSGKSESVQPIKAHIVKNRVGDQNVSVELMFNGGRNEFR